MKPLLDTLLRLRRSATAPDLSGAPPDAALLLPAASLLSHAWLAPHAVRLAQGVEPANPAASRSHR